MSLSSVASWFSAKLSALGAALKPVESTVETVVTSPTAELILNESIAALAGPGAAGMAKTAETVLAHTLAAYHAVQGQPGGLSVSFTADQVAQHIAPIYNAINPGHPQMAAELQKIAGDVATVATVATAATAPAAAAPASTTTSAPASESTAAKVEDAASNLLHEAEKLFEHDKATPPAHQGPVAEGDGTPPKESAPPANQGTADAPAPAEPPKS